MSHRRLSVLAATAAALAAGSLAGSPAAAASPQQEYRGTFYSVSFVPQLQEPTGQVARLSWDASYVIEGELPGRSTDHVDCRQVADLWRCQGSGTRYGADGSEVDFRSFIECNLTFTQCTGRLIGSGTGADGQRLVLQTETATGPDGRFTYVTRVLSGSVDEP